MDSKNIHSPTPDLTDLDARLVTDLDISAKELLKEVSTHHKVVAARPPGSITTTDYARHNNVTTATARRILNSLVTQGILTKTKINRICYYTRNENLLPHD